MQIEIRQGLPFVTTTVTHQGKSLTLSNTLLDTGSAATIFSADALLTIGIQLEPQDTIHQVRGVGGTEFVFAKTIDKIAVGSLQVDAFEIEVGAMEYGFDLQGIIGLDFLIQVGAQIDLGTFQIR